MPISTKSWQDAPSTSTPLSAAALVDLESRLGAYTDQTSTASIRWTTGRWVTPMGGALSTVGVTEGTAVAAPIFVPYGKPIDAMACEVVTTAGSAGSVLRLGIATDNGSGLPGTVVVDAGTVDSTTISIKTATLGSSYTPTNPGWHWLILVCQGGATTKPVTRALAGSHNLGVSASAASGNTAFAAMITNETTISGALPSDFSAFTFTLLSPAPRIQIRAG